MKVKQKISRFIINILQIIGPKKVKILGKKYIINKDVFNPKLYLTSSLMAKQINVNPEHDVLDVGTGSGVLAIVAAQKAKKVIATDINPKAVQCTKENIKNNNLKNVKVYQGNLFSPLKPKDKFDVILFNPPYLEGSLKTPIDQALNDPDKKIIKRFFKQAKNHLKPKGYIQILYSSLADIDVFLKITKDLGWKNKILFKKKILFETFFIYKIY